MFQKNLQLIKNAFLSRLCLKKIETRGMRGKLFKECMRCPLQLTTATKSHCVLKNMTKALRNWCSPILRCKPSISCQAHFFEYNINKVSHVNFHTRQAIHHEITTYGICQLPKPTHPQPQSDRWFRTTPLSQTTFQTLLVHVCIYVETIVRYHLLSDHLSTNQCKATITQATTFLFEH